MTELTVEDATNSIYQSLHADNADIDTHIASLKAALAKAGRDTTVASRRNTAGLSRKFHRHTALAKIGLHQLAAGAVVLRDLCRVEDGFLLAGLCECRLQKCDMRVDIGIVRVERFINAVGCVFYGQFGHVRAPDAISLALSTCFDAILEMSVDCTWAFKGGIFEPS